MSKRFRYNFISDMLGEDKEEILRFYAKKTKSALSATLANFVGTGCLALFIIATFPCATTF